MIVAGGRRKAAEVSQDEQGGPPISEKQTGLLCIALSIINVLLFLRMFDVYLGVGTTAMALAIAAAFAFPGVRVIYAILNGRSESGDTHDVYVILSSEDTPREFSLLLH